MKTVAVVDYGMGNLRSVAQAVHARRRTAAGFEVVVTARPEEVRAADRVVLPGPGRDARLHARAARVRPAARRCSRPRRRKPLFGVCVGMQMLLERSEEGPHARAWA